MSDELTPTTSAMHGITTIQNVSRAVADRIAGLERRAKHSRVLAWLFFALPLVGSAALATFGPETIVFSVYLCLWTMPVGAALHAHRVRGYREASRLDRGDDVAWIGLEDGLVFFSDEGVFVEKRGGFRPYRVESRRFRDVTVADGKLTLHGFDFQSGATYAMTIDVPAGWQDSDTRRVAAKVGSDAP